MDKPPKQRSDAIFDRFWPTADNRNAYNHKTLEYGMRNRPQESINGFVLFALERFEAVVVALHSGTTDAGLSAKMALLEARIVELEIARAKHATDRGVALEKARSARWPKANIPRNTEEAA